MDERPTDWWENVEISEITTADHSVLMAGIRDEIIDEIYDMDSPTHELRNAETGEVEWTPEDDLSITSLELQKNRVALFSLSIGVMERQLEDVLRYGLLTSEFPGKYDENNGVFNRAFAKNLELAWKSGLIEKGLYDKAVDVNTARNKLVHDPRYRYTVSNVSATVQRVKKAVEAPEQMHSVWKDHVERFS